MSNKQQIPEKLLIEEQRLIKKLNNLENQLRSQEGTVLKTRVGAGKNTRRSDRRFLENKGKAISSRTKRADKSKLAEIKKITAITRKKLRHTQDQIADYNPFLRRKKKLKLLINRTIKRLKQFL